MEQKTLTQTDWNSLPEEKGHYELPEGWKWVKNEYLCEFITGGTPSKKVSEYWENGTIKWLVSGDINKGIISDCEGRITQKGLENSNAKYLPINSVLIGLNGQGKTRGMVAILKTRATCNQSIVAMHPQKDSNLYYRYLYFNLKSRYQEIRNLTGDKKRSGLNIPILKNLPIPLPFTTDGKIDLEKQKQIVAKIEEIFSRVDNAIKLREEVINKTQKIFEMVLEEIFREAKEDKEGWRWVKLGDIVNIHDKKRIPLSKREREKRKGNFPYCGANGIIDYINDYLFDGEYLLVAEDGGFFKKGEKSAYLMSGKFWVNNHAHIINAKNNITLSTYLHYYFIVEDIEPYCSGATRLKLTQEKLKQIPIPLPFRDNQPDLEKQKQIVEKLDKLNEKIEKMKELQSNEIKKLKLLKEQILYKAFRGQLI